MEGELIEAVESHRFEPVAAAQWRNDELNFRSIPALLESLALNPGRPGLRACEEALDERVLRALAGDLDSPDRALGREATRRLWDACQTPDFRKTTADDHIRLVRTLFEHLVGPTMRLSDDWMAAQFRQIDRIEGDIDTLSARLAGVRTLAYLSHRPDWLVHPGHWQEQTRALEDRLSDTLHEKLANSWPEWRPMAR
jgi:ATP-dependent RNA helicase SUPV3L1/SUV3